MKKVMCSETDCLNMNDGECALKELRIDCGQCMSFQSYRTLPEYGERFWKLIRHPDGGMVRVSALGKRIEYGELTFYTRDRVESCAMRLYEARTGVLCGLIYDLQNDYDEILSKLQSQPDVTEYPEYGSKEVGA